MLRNYQSWMRLLVCKSFLTLAMVIPSYTQASEIEDPFMERNLAILSGQAPHLLEEIGLGNQSPAFDDDQWILQEDGSPLQVIRKVGVLDSFLFKREYSDNEGAQNVDESRKVFNVLVAKALSRIIFQRATIYPFDNRGTCSAMALDFLARYIQVRSQLIDEDEITAHVASFSPFYRTSNSTFMSRQAAYNTIAVSNISYDDAMHELNNDKIKYRKMQSLANYHNIKLNPRTGSIPLREIESGRAEFKQKINQLPKGYYVIRALSPTNNHKLEHYGHTMILVKESGFAIFFDNASGAIKITSELDQDVGEHVEGVMIKWGIPEYRVYKAGCGNGGCVHLSTEMK